MITDNDLSYDLKNGTGHGHGSGVGTINNDGYGRGHACGGWRGGEGYDYNPGCSRLGILSFGGGSGNGYGNSYGYGYG